MTSEEQTQSQSQPPLKGQWPEKKSTEEMPLKSESSQHLNGSSHAREGREYQMRFTGTGKEYFKIWIVNLLLSIVTLGLYSPWATVRSKRYLLGNTWLDNHNFDFHGNPVAMLKGRIIAMVLLGLYAFGGYIHPTIPLIVLVIGLLIFPVFIVSSYRFSLMNTSYRNIRFQFLGTVKKAYVMYWPLYLILIAAIALFSVLLGELTYLRYILATENESALIFFLQTYQWVLYALVILVLVYYPLFIRNRSLFMVNYASFGDHRFCTEITYGSIIKLYLLCFLVVIIGIVILWVLVGVSAFMFLVNVPQIAIMIVNYAFIVPMMLYFFSFWQSGLVNLIFKHASLEDDKLIIKWTSGSYWKVLVKNFFITVFTLGFAYPWAVINLARYKAEKTKIHSDGFDQYTGKSTHNDNALGDEVTNAFDMDFGV